MFSIIENDVESELGMVRTAVWTENNWGSDVELRHTYMTL